MKVISQGAEAQLILDGEVLIKNRVPKSYRNEELDNKLRKQRTRKEAKVLEDVKDIIPVPKLISVDEKEMTISMEYIEGDKVRDVLESSDFEKLCKEIGKNVALLHNANIIHGDLTTSNFILSKVDAKVYFIDFGLSFTSDKVEDKAVDLHLLRQALESKHYKIFDEAINFVFEGYKSASNNFEEIKKRYDLVELRGRNKQKGS